MSDEKIKDRKDSDLFQAETFFEEFQQELKAKGRVDLAEWASEVPNELQEEVIARLLAIYIRFCQERGWTVHLADFVKRFPRFQSFIDQLENGPSAENSAEETVSTFSLTASTEYSVVDRPWREGGQGVLHKASDKDIGGRQVVVKFLKDAKQGDDFKKEVEVTAKLEHPGVAAVFAQGVEETPSKRPFYVMRLIHGQPLENEIAEFHNPVHSGKRQTRAFNPAQEGGIAPLLENIILACNTVSHAHSVGVLHCDLKPKNIVCGRFGATIVLDWGSARSYDMPQSQASDSGPPLELSADTSHSHTVAYASPEQLAQKNLTPRSDVYSMGATLYQALTGSAPFGDDRRADSTFKSPREIDRRIPKRLEAICTKAMQPLPQDRYDSVHKFATDLTNWLRDEGIAAVPDTFMEKGFRIARHHKHATTMGLFAVFALTVLGLMIWNMRVEAHQISHSLDSALTLIEGLCQPLENDEVDNSEEFNDRASQIEEFAQKYIEENKKNTKDPNLARAHELSGLIAFYHHNHPQDAIDSLEEAKEPKNHLQDAIDSLEEAEVIYASIDFDMKLAGNKVRQARWLRERARKEEPGYDSKRDAFRKLTEAIDVLKVKKDKQAPEIRAEAHHVKGEILNFDKRKILNTNKRKILNTNTGVLDLPISREIKFGEEQTAENVENNLKESLLCFTKAITILEKDYKHSRNLARGYGFRGDVETALGDYSNAAQDYQNSLKIRKSEWEKDKESDENSFQLARGLANFGALVRDMGHEDLDANFLKLLDLKEVKEGTTGDPIEVQVCDKYLHEALKYNEPVFRRGEHSDVRSKTDYRWINSIAAELYFFAANRPGINLEKKKVYLEKAGEFADRAIVDRHSEDPNEVEQRVRNILSTSYMVKLQIACSTSANEEKIDEFARKVKTFVGVNKREYRGYPGLTDEQLLQHAIQLAATKDIELQEAVEEMDERGFGKNARVKKHLRCFDDEEVKKVVGVILEAKSN